jgi:hypothetical protein
VKTGWYNSRQPGKLNKYLKKQELTNLAEFFNEGYGLKRGAGMV